MAKRLYRNEVSNETKEKQRVAHQNKKHSIETKNKISQSLQKYWAGLPTKPSTNNNNQTTTEKIYGEK